MFLLAGVLATTSCETDFDNPNAATDEQLFSSREGILAASVGMQQLYSTTGLRWMVETPAITTREVAITSTFQNLIDLESGGDIPNNTSNIEGLWSTMLRVIGIAEDVVVEAESLELAAGTRSGLVAFAKLFHAMSIGAMAQNYEQVIVINSEDNAPFIDRIAAFNRAVELLTEAQNEITATPYSPEFEGTVLRGEIDLENTINAMLARFNLYAGNYDAAIAAASQVDQTSTSVFAYDAQNLNPIWGRVYQNGVDNFKPRDNFGLPEDIFPFDEADGRVDFYLIPLDEENINLLPIEDLAGFFDAESGQEAIPIYLPDEMNLIIAEANLRSSTPDTGAAITALNLVLTDNDDVFGVNANLPEYAGDTSVDALLLEVYRNRRAELFLNGSSLEDSRRFGRPDPTPSPQNFDEERNRNFYPYPQTERDNNTNTPADPAI